MGTLAAAIAQLENVNPVYNNPGAISGTGDTGSSFGDGIGIYSTLDAGQAALNNQIAKIYSGSSKIYNPNMTLDQFGSKYAPNDPLYGSKLASILGTSSSTPLSNIPSGVNSSKGLDYYIGIVQGGLDSSGLGSFGTTAIATANPAIGTFMSYFGRSIEDVAVIVVGFILIAAGLFAFKNTQTIIETGTRVVKKAAEVAG